MEILKEITPWDCEFNVCNHTYLIDNKGRVVAYAIDSGDEVVQLKTGFNIDKRYRKFIKSDHAGLDKIAKTIPEQKQEKIKPIKSDNVRVFKVKSDTKEYDVQYNISGNFFVCSCVGFGYRKKCKHVDAVKPLIK